MDTYDHVKGELHGQLSLFPEWEAEKRKERNTVLRVIGATVIALVLVFFAGMALAEEPHYTAGEQVDDHLMNFCANEQAATYVLTMQKRHGMPRAVAAFTEYAKYGVCNSLIGDFVPMSIVGQVGMGHPLHGVWWVYIMKVHSPYTEDVAYMLTEATLLGEIEDFIVGGMDI